MSKAMIILFVIEFAALGFDAAIKGQYALALYGFGGAILNIGIFKMNF